MQLDKQEAYLTPEDILIGVENGIPEALVKRRFYQWGWTKRKALHHPYKQLSDKQEWLDLARSNGICRMTFTSRVLRGWGFRKAATTKVSGQKKVHRTEENIRYAKIAEENGIARSVFWNRIYKGADPLKASTVPLQVKGGNMYGKNNLFRSIRE